MSTATGPDITPPPARVTRAVRLRLLAALVALACGVAAVVVAVLLVHGTLAT